MAENNHCSTEHGAKCACHCHIAFKILYIGFILLPIIAGIDKFFNYLTVWDQYLSPAYNVFGSSQTTMRIVGVIEIIAGLGVLVKPRLFAYIIAIWLWAVIVNLLLIGKYYDIALRDFGLSLGALALANLTCGSSCKVKKD